MYEISVRDYNGDSDFDLIKSWRDKRKILSVPKSLLPPTGVIGSSNGVPIVSGFMLKTDAAYTTICHLSSDPDVPNEERSVALDAVLERLIVISFNTGYYVISAGTNLESLGGRYAKLGFTRTDENVSVYMRVMDRPSVIKENQVCQQVVQ